MSSDLVDVTEQAGVVTARFLTATVGERDATSMAPAVHDAMEPLGQSLRWLVIDFSQVTFLNSYGLGMCIDLSRRAEAQAGQTALIGLSQELRDLLHVVKVERLFSIVDDEADLKTLVARG